jgi:hypothetical protein
MLPAAWEALDEVPGPPSRIGGDGRAASSDPLGKEANVTETQLQEREAAQEEILSWRLEQLMLAGYGPGEAKLLAQRGDVDLHAATDLLRNGCPPELAVAILR